MVVCKYMPPFSFASMYSDMFFLWRQRVEGRNPVVHKKCKMFNPRLHLA